MMKRAKSGFSKHPKINNGGQAATTPSAGGNKREEMVLSGHKRLDM